MGGADPARGPGVAGFGAAVRCGSGGDRRDNVIEAADNLREGMTGGEFVKFLRAFIGGHLDVGLAGQARYDRFDQSAPQTMPRRKPSRLTMPVMRIKGIGAVSRDSRTAPRVS